MEWIRTANLGEYDVISAFSELTEIDWVKSQFNIEKGDIVYIYVGVPYSRIMFKTICIEPSINVENCIDDRKFWRVNEISNANEYIRLRLISVIENENLSLHKLNELGYVKARIQGAYKSSNYPELFDYVDTISNQVTVKLESRILKAGAPDMEFHTITQALNYCFAANINYRYQKGTYPQKKDAWKYYMAWFPNFAYTRNDKLMPGSNSLNSNWYNIISDDETEIQEFNYGEVKEKYNEEINFYRLVFGRKKNQEYRFLGVYRMVSSYEEDKNYAFRRYERVTEMFNTSRIFDEPEFEIDSINKIYNLSSITNTEKEILAKARIGQGLFREKLINKYSGGCMMCGLKCKQLLIASHIKEWSKSNNEERVDVNNGLLLCIIHDSLFDKHLITFDDGGKIMISAKLNKEDIDLCNISYESKIKTTKEINQYMEYHRNVFLEENRNYGKE